MNQEPKVSIITVVFNGEKTIGRTIESVLQQSYKNIEYLIIDGLSKDNTLEVVKGYIASNSNIKLVSEADRGLYDAMNKGIALSSGELIGIINSDDWYEADAVENMVNEYLKHGTGVYYGFERRLVNNLEFIVERSHHQFLHKKMIQHPTTFVAKSVYDKHGVFALKYPYSADLDLMLRFQAQQVPFYMLDKIISNFSMEGLTFTSKGLADNLRCRRDHGHISKKDYLLRYSKLKLKDIFKR